MILLRRLGGPLFALNPDLIERAEATPDTVVTMVNGNKYLVCESLTEMTELIRDHRARVIALAESMAIDSAGIAGAGSRGNAPHLHDVSAPANDNSVVPIRSREA